MHALAGVGGDAGTGGAAAMTSGLRARDRARARCRRVTAARSGEAVAALRVGHAVGACARHGAQLSVRSAAVRCRRGRCRCAVEPSISRRRGCREQGLRRGLLVVDRRRFGRGRPAERCAGADARRPAWRSRLDGFARCWPVGVTRCSPRAHMRTGAVIRSRSRGPCSVSFRRCTETRACGSCLTGVGVRWSTCRSRVRSRGTSIRGRTIRRWWQGWGEFRRLARSVSVDGRERRLWRVGMRWLRLMGRPSSASELYERTRSAAVL